MPFDLTPFTYSPEKRRLEVRLSEVFKKGGTKQELAKAYKKNIDNLNATEWIEKGWKLIISGNTDYAIKAFSKAMELNPNFADAYMDRGLAYTILGNHQQAIEDYNKVIELNNRYTKIYLVRGLAYGWLGNYPQAINDFSDNCLDWSNCGILCKNP